MEISPDWSSADEDKMLRETDKIEQHIQQNNQNMDFSSSDEDEMVRLTDRVEKRKYKCNVCDKMFEHKKTLIRHQLSHTYFVKCHICGQKFRRKDYLKKHLKNVHGVNTTTFQCNHCPDSFNRNEHLYNHMVITHPLNQPANSQHQTTSSSETSPVETRNISLNNALNNSAEIATIEPQESEQNDLLGFLANTRLPIREYLLSRVTQHPIKWYLCVQLELERLTPDGENTVSTPHFRSRTYVLLNLETYNEHDLNEALQKIIKSLEEFMRNGSGWVLKKVLHLEIHTVKYTPLKASSYIPLPKTLQNSSILNIRNDDQKCFQWSVLASLHPGGSTNVNDYVTFEYELNMSNIPCPVSLSKMNKFEQQNPHISINVFGYEDKEIFPMRITKQKGRFYHINLLFLQVGDNTHYCLIRNLNTFLFRTKSSKNKTYFCSYCLHGFVRQDLLDNHIDYCSVNGAQKVELPQPGDNVLQFKDFEKTLRVPFIIYADFECLNTPMQNRNHVAKQTPCAFAYKVVCEDPQYTKPTVTYVGEDASQQFLHYMIKEQDQIQFILNDIQPMKLTQEDQLKFKSAIQCCICDKTLPVFDKQYGGIVRHHNHLTGKFIGAAHNVCNVNCKQAEFLPVVFHNLRGYDSHLIMQSVGIFKDRNIKCIATNMEKYISFSLGSLKFIDSLQFMNSSLEKLVENVRLSGDHCFQMFYDDFPNRPHADLLLRKGVFPYQYMDSMDRLKETQLPPREAFYSDLSKQTISEMDYDHACNVFYTLHMNTLQDYMLTYVKTDVSLLACVFEEFRNVCLSKYNLDPAHYYGAPGLSWSACLKMTCVELELFTDIDMVLFIEKGVRGGVSQVSNRLKTANNPYLNGYDRTKPTSYLCYEDANNLYGWSMSQYLPHSDFRWLNEQETNQLDIMSIKEDGDSGYILEVSLGYPASLHDFTNDYPLCPEKMHVEDIDLSSYSQSLWKQLHGTGHMQEFHPKRSKVEKLVLSLNDKDKYIVHYRVLQLYLQLGMKIKQLHRVLQFHQEPYLKPYIDFNTECRKHAKTEFEKDFYKLLNNAIFGKTLQNCRKYVDVKLAHTEKKMRKYAAKPTFQRMKIFSEDLVGVECNYTKVNFVQPVYCGMVILDLAKLLMYNYYYNHLKPKYMGNLTLLATDTDSFMFYVKTDDVYRDMLHNLHLYDTSNYSTNHPLFTNDRKKKIGVFKDELGGIPMKEFVALRPKMYSYVYDKNDEEFNEKRCKGISRAVVKKELVHEHYKQTLLTSSQTKSTMYGLRSDHHIMYCDKINKTSLSAFDDKRYWLDDGITSLAYGHYRIP